MLEKLYQDLLNKYGPQGWWPLLELHGNGGINPTRSGSINGYHPGDYSYPKTGPQRFEICIGAILAQNTAWPNVEKALLNLRDSSCLHPKGILRCSDSRLGELIKQSGYFNQKAKKLKIFSKYFMEKEDSIPTRDELLSLWGIGPETADSMLLYAYSIPSFVVDAYSRRLLKELGLIQGKESYNHIQILFESQIRKDVVIYQEFHALIVENAKI